MATSRLSGVLCQLRRAALLRDGGMSDVQLLACFIARRDEAAFEALVRRHGPMVLGVCRRLLRHEQDAEDAFQATFLVLARKAASIARRELVGNWLYGAAYRAALEVKAAARRRARERQVTEMPEPAAVEQTDPWQEVRPLLDQELARLPDKYRAAVVLCDLEGRSRKEAARLLGIPEGTLSSRLATARKRLGGRLTRSGLAPLGGTLAAALSQHAAPAGVPAPLLVSTVQAATALAAGHAAAASVTPAGAAALAERVVRAMFVSRLKTAAALVFVTGLLLAGGGALTYGTLAAGPADAQKEHAPRPAAPAEKVGEVRRFEGHTDWVYTVALSPDGRRALSGSSSEEDADAVVRLWDVETGKELRRLEGHTSGVMSVAFSPDGKRAASAGDDATMRLWDLETGKELKRCEGHADQVWAVAFSPDGKRVMSGSRDTTLRLWDVKSGKELTRFDGHSDGVRTVAFAPDGKRVLSGSFDGTVRLWDVETGKEVRTFEGHEAGVQCVAFSRDGRRAASCGLDHTIRLWDVESAKELYTFDDHTDAVTSFAFTPDGKRLVSGSWDRTVRVWDVESGEIIHGFFGHKAYVQSVAVSSDGRYALSGSRDKTLRLWRLPK
jgi:RNA polymerase sigma factor (sigma-70 family)